MGPKLAGLMLALAGLAYCSTSAAAAVKPVATGTIYGGQTKQRDPFVLALSRDRTHVARALLFVEATCTDDKQVIVDLPARFVARAKPPTVVNVGDNVFFRRALSRAGALVADGLSSVDYGYADADVSEHFAAKVRGHVATGTFRAFLTMRDKTTHRKFATCETSTVTWSASSLPRRVFGGLTSQGLPAVIEMNALGTRVDRLRIAWSSTCANTGEYALGDRYDDLGLSAAREFGGTWSEVVDGPDGSRSVYDYELAGSVRRTKASGVLEIKETDLDPQGATTDTCDTGAITWQLRSS
jgi:hypothetical protein